MPLVDLPAANDARSGRRFLLDLDRRLERLDREILIADWNLETGRSTAGSERWQLQRGALLSDERLIPWVRAARRRRWSALDARRLELLERVLLDTQVEQAPEIVRLRSRLRRRVVAFRPLWNGRRVPRSVVQRAVRLDPRSSVRRRAFYALDPLYRPMEEDVRALIHLRNDRARAFGFRTFAEMRLGFAGISPARVAGVAEAALRGANVPLRELRETPGAAADEGWRPWDIHYALSRGAELPESAFPRTPMLPRILAAVRQWGFPVDRMRFRVVFHDLPAGGLTLAPDPPTDVRILVHREGGWHAYHVMFHEVGHAVHSASIRSPRHLLRWHENVPGFGGFHEGIGELFAEIAVQEEWLRTQRGIPPATLRAFLASCRMGELRGVASTTSWMRVEQALYRNPDRDPMPEATRFERSLFGFDSYRPRSFVDAFWIETPSYAPSYVLAALFRSQLGAALVERFGEPFWPNRRIGPWLAREWFAPGSLVEWLPRLRRWTGRPLGAAAFRAKVGLR